MTLLIAKKSPGFPGLFRLNSQHYLVVGFHGFLGGDAEFSQVVNYLVGAVVIHAHPSYGIHTAMLIDSLPDMGSGNKFLAAPQPDVGVYTQSGIEVELEVVGDIANLFQESLPVSFRDFFHNFDHLGKSMPDGCELVTPLSISFDIL